MLYRLIRPVARYVLGYYYREITIEGLENIPETGAVILAANHPTAFIEPCILACYQERPLHFLPRGNLYKNRLATAVLRALHILPVYRLEDGGYGKLRENYATFEACYDALSRGRALMILAEGRCIHERKLRPLRKGTARVALGALDRDATLREVLVVPVGVNFVAADRVRSDVHLRCGPPLSAAAYLERYRQSEPTTIRAFTNDLRTALSPLVWQSPAPAFDDVAEIIIRLSREGGYQPDLTDCRRLAEPARHYASLLLRHGLTTAEVARATEPRRPPPNLFAGLLRVLDVINGALLLLPQWILWGIAQLIAKVFPATIEFYSPVRFAAVAVGSLLFIPLFFLVGWPYKIYLLLSLLLTGWSLRKLEAVRDWSRRRYWDQLPIPDRRAILAARAALLEELSGDRGD